MEFINWCNQNQGFLSFILSCCTIIISIIAIVISVLNTILQNKKKFSIYAMFLLDENEKENLRIHIVNCGYKVLGIESISVMYKKMHISPSKNNDNNKTLMPTESMNLHYSVDRRYMEQIEYKELNRDINIIDTYGKKHKCKRIYPAI